MSRNKYIQVYDGETHTYKKEAFILYRDKDSKKLKRKGYVIDTCCCDCNLVHNIYMWIEKDKLHKIVFRNNGSTGQLRRYNNFIKK